MANMFSGNTEKRIPKSLKECYATDNVTHNLWTWCERLEKWGFRLCLFLGIIGIVSIISNGIEMAKLIEELNIDMKEIKTAAAELGIEIKPVFEVVLEGIFDWLFYCFLEYCSYHILALLIGSLATIVQHTKITANVALFNAAKDNPTCYEEDKAPEPTYNAPESNTPKTYYSKVLSEIQENEATKSWECSNCGFMNSHSAIYCKGCGKHK